MGVPAVFRVTLFALTLIPGEGSGRARVAVDSLLVVNEPDDAAVATNRLSRGDEVFIIRDGMDGWLAIQPPKGSFSLVESTEVEEIDANRARVTVAFAQVRRGLVGAKLPGPPCLRLRRETVVQLLDRRPLVVRQRGESRTWLAIAPPKDEIRFVREEGLVRVSSEEESDLNSRGRDSLVSSISEMAPEAPRARKQRDSAPLEQVVVDRELTTVGPANDEAALAPDFAGALRKVTARHRQALQSALGAWELDSVRADYQKLLDRADSSEERAAVTSRLTVLGRQMQASAAARGMEKLIESSRRRDGEIAGSSRLPLTSRESRPSYEANGLLQTSARMHQGQRVYALIDEKGGLAAYLLMPPGLAVREFVSHRVGVNGQWQYDEDLHKTLIIVSDLEPLIDNR